jgi:glutaredoxin
MEPSEAYAMKSKILLILFLLLPFSAQSADKVDLHVFWSKDCPHCHKALSFLKKVSSQHPWMNVKIKEISENSRHQQEYAQMASLAGEPADVVPAFFFCGMMYAGYNGDESTGQWIVETMSSCRSEQASLTEH